MPLAHSDRTLRVPYVQHLLRLAPTKSPDIIEHPCFATSNSPLSLFASPHRYTACNFPLLLVPSLGLDISSSVADLARRLGPEY